MKGERGLKKKAHFIPMKKTICFVFPYREISGVPVLFYNMANAFAEYFKEKYNVSVLDYSDGVMAGYISENVTLKVIETGQPCVLDDDYIVMQAILPSAMRPEYRISDKSKILFWVLHPLNFMPVVFPINFFPNFIANNVKKYSDIIRRFYRKEYKNLNLFIKKIDEGNSLVFNTETYYTETNMFLDYKIKDIKILPVAASDPESVNKKETNEVLSCGWVGRLCDFKIHILNYTLNKMATFALQQKKEIVFHIIGTGELEHLLGSYDNEYFKQIKVGGLKKTELDRYLAENVDLAFSMGVSAIESEKLGIPTVLLDVSYEPVREGYKFRWLHHVDNYDIGHMMLDSDFEPGNDTLDRIINEFLVNHDELSKLAYEYYYNNYSTLAIAKKMDTMLGDISVAWGDLPESVKKRNIFRTVYNLLKYRLL